MVPFILWVIIRTYITNILEVSYKYLELFTLTPVDPPYLGRLDQLVEIQHVPQLSCFANPLFSIIPSAHNCHDSTEYRICNMTCTITLMISAYLYLVRLHKK